LPIVFYPIIAFGKSTYTAKSEKSAPKAVQAPAPKKIIKKK
jgi:hypothetical protein